MLVDPIPAPLFLHLPTYRGDARRPHHRTEAGQARRLDRPARRAHSAGHRTPPPGPDPAHGSHSTSHIYTPTNPARRPRGNEHLTVFWPVRWATCPGTGAGNGILSGDVSTRERLTSGATTHPLPVGREVSPGLDAVRNASGLVACQRDGTTSLPRAWDHLEVGVSITGSRLRCQRRRAGAGRVVGRRGPRSRAGGRRR